MNPRVSRSSALASKATGFPIAKIAAKLAIGYTLDEVRNEITGGATPASFEPSIDYVVTKIPRFAFEKFKDANDRLTTQMKSVGEVMAMGRTFQESFQKALRGLEVGVDGMNEKTQDREVLEKELGEPGPERIWYVGDAFAQGMSVDEVHDLTKIDKWFLVQIEFDLGSVHGALALREDGFETSMVNCNPEPLSTDYDTSDRLYFEPLTLEDVLEIVDKEKPTGVIVQYGGQTPLKLALGLEREGVPIIGTSPDMIDAAEDRERFQKLLHELKLKQPPNATARTEPEALEKAAALGYPLVVRPSYVLGGRAMEIVHEQRDLERYMREAVKVSHDSPVLLDRFLNDAIECDVDCIRDAGSNGAEGSTFIGGVMEHIEQAGVHSGDSACSLPPYSLSAATVIEI